ncbi:sushi domain-containing protein 1 isoform X7 [Lepisosteus oculatus]|uniref:sushi domain-containing protein 1 isoform X7 n=1 Tax=Lepisosteus oculatus TaxID=7918 RepID=UPI00371586A2
MSLIMSLRRIAMLSTAFVLFLTCLQLQIYDAVATSDTLDVCSSCHINATCDPRKDGTGGKMCNCLWGFMGNGRTQCIDKDECQIGTHKICGEHTVCHNTYGSFYCTCQHGYSPTNNMPVFIPNDGTFCQDIDECQVEGICKDGGLCWNVPGSFSCNCSEGYKIRNGTEPFHPAKDGAFCEEIDCGDPPILPHTTIQWDTDRGPGSAVYYSCTEGFYKAEGLNISTCTLTGHWKNASLVCKEVDCGAPPVLPHACMLWNGSTGLGSVVHYECDQGFYNAGGRNFSLCTKNNRWDNVSLICEEINCGPPPVIAHTYMQWDNTTGLGSVVYYKCVEGLYQQEGKNSSICTSDRQWENITVTCKEIDCGSPPCVDHAKVLQLNGTVVGSMLQYSCKDGFISQGGTTISVCTNTGEWTAVTLLCKEKKPAISRILIFKEKCLQWQAERNGQEKEIYKVHYIGLRDYQKQFVDKKTKHFTSAKTSAEICLNLLPGTNYTINITALSAGFSSTVNLTTSIGDPPIPRLTYKDVEGPLPTLQLHKTANSNDPISFYQVFVLPLEGFSMFDCSSPSAPHCYSQDKPWGAYVAAQIHAKDIGSELVFTVGDRRYYGEYYNAPLKEGTSYYIILKIVTQWGRARKQSCVFWAKTRELSHTIQHVTIVAGGSVGLIAFVVFLGFSISWYFKKK